MRYLISNTAEIMESLVWITTIYIFHCDVIQSDHFLSWKWAKAQLKTIHCVRVFRITQLCTIAVTSQRISYMYFPANFIFSFSIIQCFFPFLIYLCKNISSLCFPSELRFYRMFLPTNRYLISTFTLPNFLP